LKRDGKSNRVFSLVGDGESQEGQIWEAVQVASKYKLDNLTIIVDRNRLQNDGTVEEIMPIGNLADKYKAFGCEVRQTDGHNIEKLIDTFEELGTISGKPKCIVAETVKGKGVSFMEDVVSWHGTAPNDEQFRRAMDEVEGTL
jgi:transketolase